MTNSLCWIITWNMETTTTLLKFEVSKLFSLLIENIMHRSRSRKLMQFYKFLKPKDNDKILEVGVANHEYSSVDNFLIKKYPYPENITVLSIGDLSEFQKKYPAVKAITYDGKLFPFENKTFDITHSNAVIEHVGHFEEQRLFLKEIVRVSKRGMISTPNKYFPIEIHTRVPLLHLCPKNIFEKYLNLIGKSWATGDYMNLLSKKEIDKLMKQTVVKNYKIIKNRFLGMTMTFSVIWWSNYLPKCKS